jgi:hypothetical protein
VYATGDTYVFDDRAIADILGVQDYEGLIRKVCRRAVQSPKATYLLMERYTHINGFAGSSVALLAGNIGYSRELFSDQSVQPEGSSDRGMMIAPKVLAATLDEHSDHVLGHASHRTLAQVCLNAIAAYARLSVAERSILDRKPPCLLALVEQFKDTYRGTAGNAPSLVRALGYHLASEYLADREYQIKDEEIWFRYPDEKFRKTVKRGRKTDGTWFGHWTWVTVHGHFGTAEGDQGHGVEHDHYLSAVEALKAAAKFRPRELTNDEMFSLAVEGMRAFKDQWTAFYTIVLDEIEANTRECHSCFLPSSAASPWISDQQNPDQCSALR